MDAVEEQQLRAISEALAGAEQSPWEPRCVSKAFASRPGGLVLTMQGWIDLDAVCSPFLEGRLPDGDDAVAQLSAAVDAFGLGPLEVKPDDAIELAEAMRKAVTEAFSMQLKMQPPGDTSPKAPGGFGSWLPIFACLVAQIGMSRLDALATPVCQAFALIATHRHNQGWLVSDATYAQRDADLTRLAEAGQEVS